MHTLAEIVARWESRRSDAIAAAGLVRLGDVAELVLADLATLAEAHQDEVLSLTEAALASGYSADWLGRQIAAGAIPNAGRKGKPAIRRADLPRKAGHVLRPEAEPDQFSTRRRIVRAARDPRSA